MRWNAVPTPLLAFAAFAARANGRQQRGDASNDPGNPQQQGQRRAARVLGTIEARVLHMREETRRAIDSYFFGEPTAYQLEIYDPATNTWSNGAPISSDRLDSGSSPPPFPQPCDSGRPALWQWP